MKKFILYLLLIKATAHGIAPSQVKILKLVKKESRKFTKYTSTIQAICLTESSLGYYSVGDEGKSLGIMQIQVATAKYIATAHPHFNWLLNLSDKRIASLLLQDDVLSIHLASAYFELNRKKFGYFGALSRYNGGARNFSYFRKVENNKLLISKWKYNEN